MIVRNKDFLHLGLLCLRFLPMPTVAEFATALKGNQGRLNPSSAQPSGVTAQRRAESPAETTAPISPGFANLGDTACRRLSRLYD
jgi:hypothetical protein